MKNIITTILFIVTVIIVSGTYYICKAASRRKLRGFHKVLIARKAYTSSEWCEKHYARETDEQKAHIAELLSQFGDELSVPIYQAVPSDRLDDLVGLPFYERVWDDDLWGVIEDAIPYPLCAEERKGITTLDDLIQACLSKSKKVVSKLERS